MPATYNERPIRRYVSWLLDRRPNVLVNTTPTFSPREHMINFYLKKKGFGCVVSGANPLNPSWCPLGGWTKIWKFCTPNELQDFESQYAYVENSLLKFNPPFGSNGKIRYLKYVASRKVAVCFRTKIINLEDTGAPVDMYVTRSDYRIYAAYIYLVPTAEGVKYEISDVCTGNYIRTPHTEDFVVAVVDAEAEKATLYGKNGSVLAEINLGYMTTDTLTYCIDVIEENRKKEAGPIPGLTVKEDFRKLQEFYIVYDTEVDWVAVLE